MKGTLLLCICLLLTSGLAHLRSENADFVAQMPNWTLPIGYEIYSGYLTFTSEFSGTEKNLHYFFLAKDPAEDLILWLNGGPGCSSLDGLLTEIGPFIFAEGQDYLNGNKNPNTWLNLGSLLFLESPTGVGFSYETSGNSSKWSDRQTTSDNYQALLEFFKKYSSYNSSDFWISGESYAGMYIPWLAEYIDANMTSNQINLKGLLIGNPYVGIPFRYWKVNFLATHSMAGPQLQSLFQKSCSPDNIMAPSCQYAMKYIELNTLYVNPYNVYGYCYYADQINNINTTGYEESVEGKLWKKYQKAGFLFSEENFGESNSGASLKTKIRETLPEAINPNDVSILPCTDALGETLYLRDPTVLEALHVNTDLPPWNVCSYEVLENWTYDLDKAYKLLPDLAKSYRILIYSGDADSICSWQGTNYWFNDIQGNNGTWRKWYTNSQQVGGFVEEETTTGVIWATVRGAGHMAPATNGKETFELIDRFINGQAI